MPDPRYRPRDFFTSPDMFGRDYDPVLLEPTSRRERAEAYAALFQHWIAAHVRVLCVGSDLTRKRLASELEMSYDRLSRLLNGSIVMRLDDLGAFMDVLPALRDDVRNTWMGLPVADPEPRRWDPWKGR